MIFTSFLKRFFKIKTHQPIAAFKLYCKNNPGASACKIYDV